MKLALTIYCFMGILAINNAQTFQSYYKQADSAYAVKDYQIFYIKLKQANLLHPYHQGIFYKLGLASALTNKKVEAFSYLKQAILINANYPLEDVADLASLKQNNQWNDLIVLQKKWQLTTVTSTPFLTIKDRQLHPEGIEWDEVEKTMYVGSIHKRKIIKIKASGEVSDFCPAATEGITSIFGIKIDRKNNLLWACSSPMQEMENYDSSARSMVFKFELTTGKVIKRFTLPSGFTNSVFGDIILNKAGQPFISDSRNNIIWTINATNETLDKFYTSPEFWNIQGLAFTPNEDDLFIADYVKGMYKLHIKNRHLTRVEVVPEVSMKGIDGVYFYKNSLLAIQNGVNPVRICHYYLDKNLEKVISYEVIDNAHPDFNEPTLGVINKNEFYYIANSQWSGYDETFKIKPAQELKDIIILKALLK